MLHQDALGRRQFSRTLLGAIGSYALLRALLGRGALAGPVAPEVHAWLAELHAMSRDLASATITPRTWQTRVAALWDRVAVHDLLAAIDFDRLVQGLTYPDLGVVTRPVSLPRLELPDGVGFHAKIFAMKQHRAIIPHGHRNMVSCHYVLEGGFRLRQYDKVAEDATHMIIQPSIDAHVTAGSHSSISDEQNNVHWLVATTDAAFTFDVIVLDLGAGKWDVSNIDPGAAEALGDGRLRARKLSVDEALKKYGRDPGKGAHG